MLAASGDTGFSTGAHLHLQVNAGEGDDAHTCSWGLADAARGAVLPVAGHRYGPEGWLPPLELEELRVELG